MSSRVLGPEYGLTAGNLMAALPEALRQDPSVFALAESVAGLLASARRKLTACGFTRPLTRFRRTCWTSWPMISRWTGGTRNTVWRKNAGL